MKTHIRHPLTPLAGFAPTFGLALIFMTGIASAQTPTANVSGITTSTNYLVTGDTNFTPAFSATGQGAILTINGATIGTGSSRAAGTGTHTSLISLGGNNGYAPGDDQAYGNLTLNLEGTLRLYGQGSSILEGLYIKTKSDDSTNTVNFNASNSVIDITTSAVSSGTANYTNAILAENQAASGGGTIITIGGSNNLFITNYTGATAREHGTGANIYASGRKQAVINITGDNTTVESWGLGATGLSASSSTTAIINITGSNTQIHTDSTGIYANGGEQAWVNITGPGSAITTAASNAHGIHASSTGGSITINNAATITTSGTGSMGIYATGSGSGKITINNTGNITTTSTSTVSGVYSHAIHANVTSTEASDGIEITHAGGSISTAGHDATGIRAESTATSGDITVTVTDANITANGVNGDGILVQTKGVNGTDADINITTNGGSINILETPSHGGNGSANYGIAALHITGTGAIANSTGDINIDNNGTTITTGTGATGIASGASAIYAHQQTNAGTTFASLGNIRITSTGDLSTLGGASHGIHALISGTASTGNITIGKTASGAAAPIEGDINTSGNASHGIYANTAGTGDITINNAANITTAGNTSHGIYAIGLGNVTVNSTGDITTSGTASYGIYARITGTTSTGNITIGTADKPIAGTITINGDGGYGIRAQNAGNGDAIVYAAATVIHTGGSNGTSGIPEGIGTHSTGDGNAIIHYTGAKVEVTGYNADAFLAEQSGAGAGNAQIYATGEIIATGSGVNPQGIVAHVSGTGEIVVEYSGTHILAGNAGTEGGNGINAGHRGTSGNVTVTSNNADALIETYGANNRGIRAYTNNAANNGDVRIGYIADRVAGTDTLTGAYIVAPVSGTIRTHGDASYGIMGYTVGGTGSIIINNAATIETGGSAAHGIVASGYDSGTKALLLAVGSGTITNSGAITTTGNESHGLYASGTGDISITNSGAITTTGTLSHGIYAAGKSNITIDNIADITTSAKSAHGILVNANSGNGDVSVTHSTGKITINEGSDDTGAGDWLNGTGVAVYISKSGTGNVSMVIDGDIETHAQNRGAGAYIHAMNNIGDLTITGSGNILAAANSSESTGTNVYSYGLAATINGSAGRNDGKVTITYSSGTIETRGDSAFALYAGVTSGTTPDGSNSAATIINTGRLITEGGSSSAIYARTENTEGAAIVVNSGNISTSGTSSHGIHAYSGSVSINAYNNAETNSVYRTAITTTPAPGSISTISTANNYANGIYAEGAGARIVSSAETTNISTTGHTSYGIHAKNGAVLSFKNGSITTQGDLSFGAAASGVGTLFTSTLALENFNITTAGDHAHAAFANYDGFVSITGGTLTASGQINSTGVVKASGYDNTPGANRGGKLVAQNTTLTAKNGASAVVVDNAGTIETTNAIITSETNAYLLGTDSQPAGAPIGSVISSTGGSIAAAGELVRTFDTTGTLTLAGITSVTNGANAVALYASSTNIDALHLILDNATSVTGDIVGGSKDIGQPDDTLWSYTAATGFNTLNLDLLNGSQFHVQRAATGDYTYNHRTTADTTSVLKISLAAGSGTNLIALGTNAAADMANDFRGTLALGNGRFILGGTANSQGATNMSALANATLRLDDLNRTEVEGAGTIAGLSFNSGTLAVRTSGSTGVNFVEDLLTVSGTLDASGGGEIEVTLSGTVHNIIPSSTKAPALIDQDNYMPPPTFETGTAGMMQNQLVAITGTVRGVGTQLSITIIPESASSGTFVSSTSALVQSGTHVADLTYDYIGVVRETGIYLDYGLAQIDALADRTVHISTAGATDDTLGAILSGSGNYTFTATDGMSIRVGNGLSDYTGSTTIATGTVTAITNNALGETSSLTLNPGSVLNLDGHAQTVHGRLVVNDAEIQIGAGGILNLDTVTNDNGYAGAGVLVSNGGKINADGAGLFTGTIKTTGTGAHGVLVTGTGSLVNAAGLSITTTGDGNSYGIGASNGATFTGTNIEITTTGNRGIGVVAEKGGAVNLVNASIDVQNVPADNSGGIVAWTDNANTSTVNAENLQLKSVGHGIASNGGSTITLTVANTVATTGTGSYGLRATGVNSVDTSKISTITADNTIITTEGAASHGVHSSSATITLNGGAIKTNGVDANAINILAGSAAASTVTGGTVAIDVTGHGIAITGTGESAVTLTAGVLAAEGNLIDVSHDSGVATITLDSLAHAITDSGVVLNAVNAGTTNATFNNMTLAGDILADTAATVNVSLTGATALTGKIDIANVNIDATSSWTLTASSDVNNLTLATGAKISFGAPAADNTVFKTLRVHGNLAGGANTITMSSNLALLRGDLLRIDGNTTGAYTLDLANHGGNPTTAGQRLMIVQAANEADFNLTGPQYRDAGLYRYYWVKGETDPSNWYLANPTGTGDEPSPYSDAGQTIVNSASLLGLSWHYGMDSLHKRMGEVRAENLVTDAPLTGNVWLRSYTYRLNAKSAMRSSRFSQDTYGITAGADKALRNGSANATWLLGAFLDMGRTDRDFRNADDGATNDIGLGLYATWLGDTGWYADIVLRADRYKHSFDSRPYGGATVSGNYTSKAQGISVEFGRMLKRSDGWWLEPSVQISQGWLNGDTYETESSDPGNRMTVRVADSDTLQYRGQLRFGRQLLSSRWHPYGKVGAARVDANGGEITALDTKVGPTYRGWRMEAGLGAAYRIDAGSQVYFDYEYAKAPAYERPWSLNLGYRRAW